MAPHAGQAPACSGCGAVMSRCSHCSRACANTPRRHGVPGRSRMTTSCDHRNTRFTSMPSAAAQPDQHAPSRSGRLEFRSQVRVIARLSLRKRRRNECWLRRRSHDAIHEVIEPVGYGAWRKDQGDEFALDRVTATLNEGEWMFRLVHGAIMPRNPPRFGLLARGEVFRAIWQRWLWRMFFRTRPKPRTVVGTPLRSAAQ